MKRLKAVLLAVLLTLPFFVGPNPVAWKTAQAAGGTGWTTYHLDNARDANDTSEPAFASVSAAWPAISVNGHVYASPLYLNGTLYIATEQDYLYAINAATGAVLSGWPVRLGTAINLSGTCGNINPVGVTSTPVIDPAAGRIYVVGLAADSSTLGYGHHLWAVNLSNGTIAYDRVVDAPGSNPTIQIQRGALALANGRVYVAFGGRYGDCGNYHGYVVSVAVADGSGLNYFEATPNSCKAGAWAPGGVAVDASGYVYVATGNGDCGYPSFDLSESVIKLNGSTLALADYWAPTDWQSLDNSDTDIGSFTPLLLGTSGYLFQAGKNGYGYIVNMASMGHVSAAVFSLHFAGNECFGAGAFDGSRIYAGCADGLHALAYNASTHQFSTAWSTGGCFADAPILAGGAVWYQDRCGNLKALDPASGAVRASVSSGSANNFSTPSAGGGLVYVSRSQGAAAFTLSAAPTGNDASTYTLDGFGGVHPAGAAPALSGAPAFNFDIARALALNTAGTGGYVLDGFGGIHPVGTAGPVSLTAYWPNWDIARAIALAPWNPSQGWVLDGFGGIHSFGGAPSITIPAYWPNWDIARGLVILPDSGQAPVSGYVLDGFGGTHPFGNAHALAGPYWPGWDIARGVALLPSATVASPTGYLVDGFGGVHPVGSSPAVSISAYWPNWDIARGITVWSSSSATNPGGWILDGFGGLHPFGATTPALSLTAYQPGHDIFRAVTGGSLPGGSITGARRYS